MSNAQKIRKPSLYLAGKVSKFCWRHGLVTGLREHTWGNGPLAQAGFTYLGPFFISCDHGCAHTPGSHGNAFGGSLAQNMARKEVARLCREAISNSDLVFAYIDSKDCFGTLVEIGWAQGLSIPVVVSFAPGVASAESNELWFPCEFADLVEYDVTQEQLPALIERSVQRYRR
jgi:hypothetical protein